MDLQNYIYVEDDILLHGTLGEIARKERRMLLASATMGILVAWSGLVPSRIPAFGIEFSLGNRVALMRVAAAIIAYFWLAFVIYGTLDLIRWRLAHRQQVVAFLRKVESRAVANKNVDRGGEDVGRFEYLDDLIEKEDDKEIYTPFLVKPAALVTVIFELVLPLIVGLYGIYAVLSFSAKLI